jgi:tetratricopeptide (TPR) repeat protein
VKGIDDPNQVAMINILDFNIRLKSGDTYSLEVMPRDGSRPAVNSEFDYPLSYMIEFEINQLDVATRNPEARVDRLKAYGAKLYGKVFVAEVEKAWLEAKDGSGFLVACIRIAPEAVGLEALPWETMFDGEEFIAAGAKTGMSRLPLDIPPQDELAAVPLPLKMLAVISSPLDLDDDHRLQIEREQEILLQAVNTPAGRGRLQVDFEDEAKLDILESSLEAGYQILHFTGHGISPKDGGGLLLEDAKGESRATATTEILQSLQKADAGLRLAVISGCQTARTLHLAGFRDLARGLAHRKVPAVIAMQFSISDPGGLKFAEALYPKLVEGRSIEEAMSAARRALLHSDDLYLQGDALAPVLIAASGRCLQTMAAPSSESEAAPPSIDFSFHLPLARLDFGFYGRRRDYRLIRDGLIYQNHRAVIVHGIGGIGKTALISHTAGRLRRHFRGVYAFDCTGGALAPERIVLDLHRYLERQGVKALESLIHQPLPPVELANYLAQVLSQWPLLLIFDNFETHLQREGSEFQIADDGLRAFVTTLVKATATGTKFLFTSRYLFDLDKKRVGTIQELSLGDLSRPEALGLMQKLPRLGAASYEEKLAAFQTFGGHPYALVTLDRYCGHSTLAEALTNTRPVQEELRGFLAIELNYSHISDRARDLLDRLAAFRGPVPPEATEWVMGEKVAEAEAFPPFLFISKLPEEWKGLDDAALLRRIGELLPERRETQGLEQPISELIDWGLLTPTHDNGQLRVLTVHSLVRDFCRDRQRVDQWRAHLRDAAAFYSNQTKVLSDDEKTPGAVWSEIEALELLMEAQDYEGGASLLMGATELLHRWGFGRFLESLHGRVMPSVGKPSRAKLLHNLGAFLQDRGEYDEALAKYEEALRIAEELGNGAGGAISLHQIGNLHYLRGEYDEALAKYEESLRIEEEMGDRARAAQSLHQIGMIHHDRGEPEEALAKYEESLGIEEEIGDRAGVARSLGEIGRIHQDRGEYDEALAKYEESLGIEEEIGYRAGVAASLHRIGIIHQDQGEYDEALAKYEESLRIAEELDDWVGVGGLLHEIGTIHQQRGEYDEALAKYEESLRIKEKMGSRAGVAKSLHQIGTIYQLRREYHEALAKYEASLRIQQEIGNRAGVAVSLYQIGTIRQQRGEYDEALAQMVRALGVFTQLQSAYEADVANNLKELRVEWGPEEFDAEWKRLTDEDTPDWLK